MDAPEVEPGIVAKEASIDGHTIKVTKDGRIIECTRCSELRNGYAEELDRRPDLKAAITRAEKLTDPRLKAQKAQEIHEKLIAERSKVVPADIDPALKEYLRGRTPSQEIKDMVNNVPRSKMKDPIYGYKVDSFEADHIVAMDQIVQMPGFTELSLPNQLAVLNNPANFMGLGKASNASKQAKSWADWPGHPDYGPIPPQVRKDMLQKEAEARIKLQQQIFDLLDNQAV